MVWSFWGITPKTLEVVLKGGFRFSVRVYSPKEPVGPDMFVLHGLCHDPAIYDMLFARLARVYKCRIIAPTLPNHGRSDDVPGPAPFQMTVELLMELVQHEDLGMGPMLVMGHSLGAALAAKLVLDLKVKHPELLYRDSVVLLMMPTGSKALDTRPISPLTAVTRLTSLVPDTIMSWCETAGTALWTGRWFQFVAGLEVFVTNPSRPVLATRLLLDAPALDEVLAELRRLGVHPYLIFAVFDPGIYFPWMMWWTGQADMSIGHHGSPIQGFGPTYWSLKRSIDRALGASIRKDDLVIAT